MKLKKTIPAVILIMALVLGFLCYRNQQLRKEYEARFVYLDGIPYEKVAEEVDLSGKPLADMEMLKAFTNLKKLDLRGSGISEGAYKTLKGMFPAAEILWDIPFQGNFYPMDTRELNITALSEADLALLDYFTELETVQADSCGDYLVLDALRRQRPSLEMTYKIPVAGEVYDHQTGQMAVPGESVEELFDLIPLFPQLQSVELLAPLAPVDRVLALREAFPEIAFTWHLEVAGIPVDESTETLDLTGKPLTVEAMDAVLPYLPNLTYVDMTDCGISNEEMDALNRRYENIKIVWTVTLGGGFRIRTDTTSFIPVKHRYWPRGNDLHNLRYCTEMIAVDVGHMEIDNCDFVAYMPHLKYLILAATQVHDLTPLTGRTELVYLELFVMKVDDVSPLLTLTALEDLNLAYTAGDFEIIRQMTWLKNLWWVRGKNYQLSWAQKQILAEAMPDCHFDFTTPSSTGGGWRELKNYYAQRDILGMYYMYG